MVTYEEKRGHDFLAIFVLGVLGGWLLSTLMRSAQHKVSSDSNLRAVSTISPSSIEIVHTEYLTSYGALTSSLKVVNERSQIDPGTDYSPLTLALIDQRIALSENVFQKVLAMPDVAAALTAISSRTKALKAEADVMPHTTAIISQGNKVVSAASKVASFANGLG